MSIVDFCGLKSCQESYAVIKSWKYSSSMWGWEHGNCTIS
jgi:hypothetical protein